MANIHSTLIEFFTSIANAIREVTGKSESIAAGDFPAAIDQIYSKKEVYDDMLARSFTKLDKCEEVTKIEQDVFNRCSLLAEISLPACSYICSGAFYSCTNLSSAYIPNCTTIENEAFAYCTSLSKIELPTAAGRYISRWAFVGCTNLREISAGFAAIMTGCFSDCINLRSASLPNVGVLDTNLFLNCYNLSEVYAPNVKEVYNGTFKNCSSLKQIELSKCTKVGTTAFANCALSKIDLPVCSAILGSAFSGCSQLTEANFSTYLSVGSSCFNNCYTLKTFRAYAGASFSPYAFKNCYELASVYLYGSEICPIANSNIFLNTPITGYSGTTGYIYVPSSLLTSYQTASIWSYFSSRFKAI